MSDNDSVFALIDALTARYPGFQVVGTTAHHEKTLSEVDFTKPVSYTHLDVYKRQGEGQARFGRNTAGKDADRGRQGCDGGAGEGAEGGGDPGRGGRAEGLSLIHI